MPVSRKHKGSTAIRQVSWLPGQCLGFTFPNPKILGPSGISKPNSPVTVAGTAPDIRRLPYYPRFRADLMRGERIGGIWRGCKGGFALSLDERGYGDLQACLLVEVGEGEKVREWLS
jgi:hypothetical protein